MKVVVAMDSFKGSIESALAGEAVRRGIKDSCPDANVQVFAISDGGEGLLAALSDPRYGLHQLTLSSSQAQDAAGQPLVTRYLWDTERKAAFLESAEVVGWISLVENGEGGDGLTLRGSSFGLGTQVKGLLDHGARQVDIGLGGTSTTDGGVGFLLALGARIWDQSGHQVTNAAGHTPLLDQPSKVELAGAAAALADPGDPRSVRGLVDVLNPLVGKRGAARMFAPQKGASPKQVKELESAMKTWARALDEVEPGASRVPGAGAAGGIGAVIAALGGTLVKGFDVVAPMIGLEESLSDADLVVTGEGAYNAQTSLGKAPASVARLAKKSGARTTISLVGSIAPGTDLPDSGERPDALFDQVRAIYPDSVPLAAAMDPDRTFNALREAAAKFVAACE